MCSGNYNITTTQLIEIYSDFKILVKAIKDDDILSPNLISMIYVYILLLKTLKKYTIRHIYCESNAVVDLLAKHILPEDTNFTMFYHPPNCLFCFPQRFARYNVP